MFIDGSHREQIRVAVTEKGQVTEFDVESFDKKQTIGNIYLAKITRIEPSLQAAFVEYGADRQGFLPFSEIHPDYYQIPVEDRKKLLESAADYYNNRKDNDNLEESVEEEGESQELINDDSIIASDDAADEISQPIDSPLVEVSEFHAPDINQVIVSSELSDETSQDNEVQDEEQDEEEEETSSVSIDIDISEDTVSTVDNDSVQENIDSDLEATPSPKRRMPQYRIQEVIKKRQILLVQVMKSERGNKGAALTTYLSLAGRYCVLMPNTACGGGISRKITNIADRQKLRATVKEFQVPDGMGLIVRTAGAQRTKAELYRDYEYLMRLWDSIRQLTLSSVAPCLVYEEGNLVKRALRDIYTRDTSKIYVQGNEIYKEARNIMKMIMPSVVRYMHHYRDPLPLFSRYQIERQLDELIQPTVNLKSGGYLVINHTEALIAIDINSGKSTNSHSVEETALRTNLEAAEEIARQLRLRDLAGLIVIDFIDMENNQNVRAVERKMRECLKHDKARLQTIPISNFGLMEMTRQRLRPAMKDLISVPCEHCQGSGHVPSLDTSALRVLRALYEEIFQKTLSVLTLNCSIEIAHYLLNKKRQELAAVENEYDLVIEINGSTKYSLNEYEIHYETKEHSEKKDRTVQLQHPTEEIINHDDEAIIEDEPIAKRPRPHKERERRRNRNNNDTRDSEQTELNERSGRIDKGSRDEKKFLERNSSKRSKFSRNRNRTNGRSNKLTVEPEIYVTASGNGVIIENPLSVQKPVEVQANDIKEAVPPLNESITENLTDKENDIQENSSSYIDDSDKATSAIELSDMPDETSDFTDGMNTNDNLEEGTKAETSEQPEVQKQARRGWWRSRFGL